MHRENSGDKHTRVTQNEEVERIETACDNWE